MESIFGVTHPDVVVTSRFNAQRGAWWVTAEQLNLRAGTVRVQVLERGWFKVATVRVHVDHRAALSPVRLTNREHPSDFDGVLQRQVELALAMVEECSPEAEPRSSSSFEARPRRRRVVR